MVTWPNLRLGVRGARFPKCGGSLRAAVAHSPTHTMKLFPFILASLLACACNSGGKVTPEGEDGSDGEPLAENVSLLRDEFGVPHIFADTDDGALFGLGDWRFEVLGLVSHSLFLQKAYGVGPHTISFPRLQPARGVEIENKWLVGDEDFKKLVAILRLAVPYTGMILTARENPKIRREMMAFGVSQIDAGSNIELGGYSQADFNSLQDRKLGLAFAEAMISFAKKIQFPTTLREIEGFNETHIERALSAAKNPQLKSKLENMPVPLTADMIDETMGSILRAAQTGDLNLINLVK